MRPLRFPSLSRTIPFIALLVLAACSKLASLTGPKASTDASAAVAGMDVVQGDMQLAQAGRLLATPIVLRIVDAKGKGVAQTPVTLLVSSGGGTIDPPTALSDSSGEIHLKWTLGAASATQTLTAMVDGIDPVVVHATALFPYTLVVAQGTAQSGKIATALKNDIVVRVQGSNGVPMIGIPVAFRVTAGGGAITPASGVTNSAGEFSAKWTMGAVAGANSIVAESGTLAPATISATATP